MPGSRPIVVIGLVIGNDLPARGPVKNLTEPRVEALFIVSIEYSQRSALADTSRKLPWLSFLLELLA
ncbi:MAG: hypothetical protein NVSMB44_24250 [Ktedonobacteraceae bacterium]